MDRRGLAEQRGTPCFEEEPVDEAGRTACATDVYGVDAVFEEVGAAEGVES